MSRVLTIPLILTGLVHASAAQAQGAHVHGLANADIALIGTSLEIAISIPADSLVGFEHAPENDTQIQAIEKAKQLLSAPDKLFEITERRCVVSNTSHTYPQNWLAQHDDDHKHDHDEHGDDHESHADISASYQFTCSGDDELILTMGLFEQFPSIANINVNWLSDTQQANATLSSSEATVTIQ